MDDYIVSARKYRPTTFKSVIGQKALTTTLKNAIHNNKLAHAYLFCGPRGVGKTTCARIFAKTINCLRPTADGEACNACESCLSFNEQRSYNIHELDAASNNSVEDIRSLIEQVRIPPQLGKYKVYIIDEVHMLSSSAFNAFLKTLEEPPHHAIFVLATTEKHKIIPTILSRCQIYDFSRISINDTVEHLSYVAQQEGVKAEPEALNVIAQKADGGMRDALSIFDQVVSFTDGNITYQAVIDNLNVLDYEYYFKLTDTILQNKVGETLLILNEILNKGFEGQNMVTGLASHFRDLMVCKDPQTIVLFEVGDVIKKRYLDFATRCENSFLYKALELTNECDLNYRISKNKRLLLEILMIRLCQLSGSPAQMQDDKKKITLQPLTANPEGNTPAQTTVTPVEKPVSPAGDTLSSKVPPPPMMTAFRSAPASSDTSPKTKIVKERLGISLKDPYGNKEKEQKQEGQPVQEVYQVNDFTSEQLNEAWIEYAHQYLKDQPHLQNSMLNSLPVITGKYTFEVLVYNQEQQQKFTNQSTGIMEYLRMQLKNAEITMLVRISEENVKQLAYTDREKYTLMAEQNPVLGRLVQEFGLKLD